MQSGYSEAIFRDLREYGLLKYFLPRLSECITADKYNFETNFFATLKALDGSIYESIERHKFVTALAKDYLEALVKEWEGEKPVFKDAYHAVKQFLLPLVPANKDVDAAVTAVLRKKKPRLKGPRAGGKPHHPRPAAV
jgi:tRNA nucleotidyltransferase/poly(A) polymerase